jgi:rubrerythrin
MAQKAFADLDEREVLTLAINGEEEDSRIYQSFADSLRTNYPHSAKIFDDMADEERGHRDMLYQLYREKFGEHLPPIRREDVKGFLKRRPVWLTQNLGVDRMRQEAEIMEMQAANFYEKAAERSRDVSIRELLHRLAEIEKGHERRAGELAEEHLRGDAAAEEEATKRRMFVLQFVQPGLAGLMDGSVSTLAPLFAAAFATHSNWETFLVGLAASIGAGISMGFAEALSDDGSLTGRGAPWIRGAVCGLMTTLGGIGHTLPYLIPESVPNAFVIATSIAVVIVLIELWVIAWIRARYMDTPFLQAAFQVVVGGVLVFLAGILIGSA